MYRPTNSWDQAALLVVVAATFALGAPEASANVFGVSTSTSSDELIDECNSLYARLADADAVTRSVEEVPASAIDTGFVATTISRLLALGGTRSNLTADSPEIADASDALNRLRNAASALRTDMTPEAANNSVRTQRDAAVASIEGLIQPARSKRYAALVSAGCLSVFANNVETELANSHRRPALRRGIGPEWRFHVGASVTSNASSGADTGVAFAPALGISYASNAQSMTLLIDPNFIESQSAELDRDQTESTFGSTILGAPLGSQSLYASYSLYPRRGNSSVTGLTLRLVARRLAFEVQEVVEEVGADGTVVVEGEDSFSFDGVLIAPTVALTTVSSGIRLGQEEFVVGFQAGVTARWLAADLASLEGPQRELLTGSDDDADHGVWAAGVDVTFFLRYRDIAPFARLTLMDGPSTSPRSMRGMQGVFGLDVLAGFKFSSEAPEAEEEEDTAALAAPVVALPVAPTTAPAPVTPPVRAPDNIVDTTQTEETDEAADSDDSDESGLGDD